MTPPMPAQMAISSAAKTSSRRQVALDHGQSDGVAVLDQPGSRRAREQPGAEPGSGAGVAPNQQDVGRRGLGDAAVRRQEDRVVGAGALRLDAGVDQLRARRRLDAGDRRVGVAVDAAGKNRSPCSEARAAGGA